MNNDLLLATNLQTNEPTAITSRMSTNSARLYTLSRDCTRSLFHEVILHLTLIAQVFFL